MSFSPTLFAFMFDKTFRYFILFIIFLIFTAFCINDCSIEQNNDIARKIIEEEVLYKAEVPSHATKTFTYYEIIYNPKKHIYLIRGSVKIQYPNPKIDDEIKNFTAVVRAYGNEERQFELKELKFKEK